MAEPKRDEESSNNLALSDAPSSPVKAEGGEEKKKDAEAAAGGIASGID